MALTIPIAAMLLAALVIADFFVPMLPSATTIAAVAGFLVGNVMLIAGLILCAAIASWAGDVLGYRALRLTRTRWRRPFFGSARVAALEARFRETLLRRPGVTTLVARFLPAGRTALAWAATAAPGYRHGRMAAMAGVIWACYLVGMGLVIGWIFGPGLLSVATTITTIAAGSVVLGWWFRGKRVDQPVR
ncbi:hypothetical protein [Glycomyces tenuis]|uniref:hypothetical protein n=1 Tax=Glycomyces tenuis TaxID=58116 RepID=UPI000402361F|nr:hypothetical protein [Glycomyces tenuis]